jgi:hypothetical protein
MQCANICHGPPSGEEKRVWGKPGKTESRSAGPLTARRGHQYLVLYALPMIYQAVGKEAEMKIVLIVAGAVCIVLGGVWFFQGLNVLLGSFMSGQKQWAGIGAALAVFGGMILLVGIYLKKRPPEDEDKEVPEKSIGKAPRKAVKKTAGQSAPKKRVQTSASRQRKSAGRQENSARKTARSSR